MATVVAPRKRERFGRRWLIIIGVLVVVIIGGIIVARGAGTAQNAAQTLPGWTTVAAQSGKIDATVSATGSIEPQAQAELRFTVDGRVVEILVKPGDKVQLGQPLARIDATDLQLGLEKAQSDLKQAQADYEELRAGATPEQIAEAKAHVSQAQGQYQQTVGSVSSADIAAAQAKLDQAQARRDRILRGVAPEDRASAEARVQQAQSALEQARSQLSSDKERARLSMESAANTLRTKQDTYSRIHWDNQNLENQLANAGLDVPQEIKDQEAAAKRDVDDAAAALDQARIAYESARQQEGTTLQTREADLRSAQADLNKVLAGPRADDLAEAQAGVQSAQAELNRLVGANRTGNVSAARASIAAAQAELEKLTADPSASALTRSEAAITRATVAVKQAEYTLTQATLMAPFAGTIARIDMRIGEPAGQRGMIAIADLSSYHVDVPVDELDVAQIQQGQQAHMILDALPDNEITGKVINVEPLATKNDKGTNTYKVTVALDPTDAPVRPGMTATVQVVTQSKEGVILVPRRAVQIENGHDYVLIPTDGIPDAKTGTPASERRPVTTGLSNGESVEITSGLKANETVLVQDVVSTWNPLNGNS